jgi:uncharacterized protein
MNDELIKYIETNVFPIYEKNDKAHDIEHINYVIKRSFELSKNLELNSNIIYTAAAYHDIGHHIDAENHEMVSAQFFLEDEQIRRFFTFDELLIIKEAIEDHRASLESSPRSIYGKLLSSADRNIDINMPLRRTYLYCLKHYPDFTLEQNIERAYNHIKEKFGNNGYAKMYLQDEIYIKYLKEIDELLTDKDSFTKRFKKVNNIKD